MPFWAIIVLGTAEALLMEVRQRCVRRRDDRIAVMSAYGTEQTRKSCRSMSAFGGKWLCNDAASA
jgi:hypothetical protein